MKKNFAISEVATAPSPTTSGTTLDVASGHGGRFAVNETAFIAPVGQSPDPTTSEVVVVTNISGDTLTITRAQESSSARDIQVGDAIYQGISAGDWSGLEQSFLEAAYPVGSIYINASVATNPATLLGFGTWVAFGAGRVLVGLDSGDANFDTLGETGGEKTHTLTTSEIPAHNHNYKALSGTFSNFALQDSNQYSTNPTGIVSESNYGSYQGYGQSSSSTRNDQIIISASHTHDTVGSGASHNNLQPYIVVHMWKRTV